MGRYVLRRLLQLIPVFFGTTFLIYILVWAVPGDPFAGKCGDRRCPDSYVAFMTEKYHLDQNVFVQYFHYMTNVIRGDFGETFGGREIADIIADSYPTTIRLAIVAIIIEGVIGITAGVVTGLRRNGFLDNLVLVSTLFLHGGADLRHRLRAAVPARRAVGDHQPDGVLGRRPGRS